MVAEIARNDSQILYRLHAIIFKTELYILLCSQRRTNGQARMALILRMPNQRDPGQNN